MSDVDKFAKEGVLRILVGNKCDLDSQREVSFESAKELADKYGIGYIETSAKDTVNIDELFITTTKTFLKKQLSIGNEGNKNISEGINLENKSGNTDEGMVNNTCC